MIMRRIQVTETTENKDLVQEDVQAETATEEVEQTEVQEEVELTIEE